MEVIKNYTNEQIDNTKRLITVLKSVPEEKRDFVAMLGIAFISGIETSETMKQTESEAKY